MGIKVSDKVSVEVTFEQVSERTEEVIQGNIFQAKRI